MPLFCFVPLLGVWGRVVREVGSREMSGNKGGGV